VEKSIRRKFVKAVMSAILRICLRTTPPQFATLYKVHWFDNEITCEAKDARTTFPSKITLTFAIEPKRLSRKWVVKINGGEQIYR
jgi:hypothetical protein